MPSFQTRILSEVKSYFDNGDTHIGYRRLLDAVIETGDITVFEQALEFCDWYDVYANAGNQPPSIVSQQVNSLLEKIDKVPVRPATTPALPQLQATQLSKRYHKGAFQLKGVDMDLYPRQIIGLVGENGNGKTTLLRLLNGELRPDSGVIRHHLFAGKDRDFYDTKTHIAFIPQRIEPWYGSLMDNLQFTAAHYGFKGKSNYTWSSLICARLNLRAFQSSTWNRISSGYKMRFELARALVRRPEILLLDEPLANLDILSQQVILEDLRFMARSASFPISIILSSQQLYEVEKVSDRVVFLKMGEPRYQDATGKMQDGGDPPQLVIELETTASREQLINAFSHLELQNISYNGGVYLLYFDSQHAIHEIISGLGASGLPVKYFRDISGSSRRFFDA